MHTVNRPADPQPEAWDDEDEDDLADPDEDD
jgi:hypothetical protein